MNSVEPTWDNARRLVLILTGTCNVMMSPVQPTPSFNWLVVTPEPLSLDRVASWATRDNCGAVVTFSGVVRNFSHERASIIALEYDASVELAHQRIEQLVDEARRRWPEISCVGIHHRVGRVELGEPTVIVAVSSPHRHDAFDAARYCIDTLKVSVPLWKRDIWLDGSAWSSDTSALEDVSGP